MPVYDPVTGTYKKRYGGANANLSAPTAAAQADSNWDYETGANLMDRAADMEDQGLGDMENYGNIGDDAILKWLYDNGGLTPEQRANLEKNNQLLDQATDQTESDYNGKYWTPEQKAAYMGDPNSGMEFFDPDAERASAEAGWGSTRGAADEMEGAMKGAYNPEALRMSSGYADSMNGAVDKMGGELDSAAYGPSLELDPEFAGKYEMSQADQDAMATRAAKDVGARYQADSDELARRASAAGTNPLGVAAAQQRMRYNSAIQEGDAATNARLAASKEAADRLKTVQDMKQSVAGRNADLRMNTAQIKGQAGMNAANDMEAKRMAGEQSATNTGIDIAKTAGAAKLANEQDIAKQRIAQGQDIRNTGMAAKRYVDQTTSDRTKTIADNDVAGNIANTTERKNGALTKYNARQAIESGAVDAARADKDTAVQYVKDRYNLGQNMAQQGASNAINTFGTTGQLANNSTGTAANYKTQQDQIKANKQGLFSKIFNGVVGAAGVASKFIP